MRMVSIIVACGKKRPNKSLRAFSNLKHLLKSLLHAQFCYKIVGEINTMYSPSCL